MKTNFKRFMSLVLVVLTLVATCVPAIAATTTECDHRYDPDSTPVLEKDATCKELGYKLFTCLDCGQAYIPDEEWEAVDLSKHVLVEKTDADCATPGKKWNECSVCGWNKDGSEESEPVSAIGNHTYNFPAGFDCSKGDATLKCTVCGKVGVAAKADCATCPAGTICEHAHYAVEKKTAEGHGEYNACAACGKSETVLHEFVTEVTKAPTCADGKMTFKCACGESYTIVIAAVMAGGTGVANHLESGLTTAATKAATCTTDGWNNRIDCDECGYDYVSGTKVNKFNHKLADGISSAYEFKADQSVTADCETDGYNRYICSRCGDIDDRTNNNMKAFGHYEVILEADWITKPDVKNKTTGKAKVTCGRTGCDWSQEMDLPFSDYKIENGTFVSANEKYFIAEDTVNGIPNIVNVAARPRYEYTAEVYNTLNRYDFYQTYYHAGNVIHNRTIPATCTTYGQYAEVCLACGWQGRTGALDPIEHSYKYEGEKKATCLVDGHTEGYVCSECNAVKPGTCTVLTAPGAHDNYNYVNKVSGKYGEQVCGTDGWYICKGTNCDEKNNGNKVVLPALRHDYKLVVETVADCRTPEDYIFECQREGCVAANREDVYNNQKYYSRSDVNYAGTFAGVGSTVDPNNHKSTTWTTVTPATCLSAGLQTGTCGACGRSDLERVLPREDHVHITTLPADHKLGAIKGLVISSKDITEANYPDAVKMEGDKVIFDLEDLYQEYGVVGVEYPATCGPNATQAKTAYICEKRVNNEEKHHWEEIVDPTEKPEHIYKFVSAYVAPTCTEAGQYELYECIICGCADEENTDTVNNGPRDGSVIPSFHSNITSMGLYNPRTGMPVDPHFTYHAKDAATCNATHNCKAGCEAYFICDKNGGCGAIFSWNPKLNRGAGAYMEVPALSDLAITFEYNVVAEGNYAIHCPTVNCTICNATGLCEGNGLKDRTVCKNCSNVVNAGTTVVNTKGGANAGTAWNGGKGHLGYEAIEYVAPTCYSTGVKSGWKCTSCNVVAYKNNESSATSTTSNKASESSIAKINHVVAQYTFTWINADAASDTNKVFAQKEDSCYGYEYTFTVCKTCQDASVQLVTPNGFTYTAMSAVTTNKITGYVASVAHINADNNELYVGWMCDDDAFEALLDPTNSLYDAELKTFTKDALVCKECNKGKEGNLATGNVLVGDANPFKVGHTASNTDNVVQDPTCQVNGYTATVCTACGIKYVTDIKEASDAYHVYDSEDFPATELTGSYTVKTCSVCGDVDVSAIANDQITGFNVKLEIVGDVFVKSGILKIKVVLVNVLDKALAIQGAEVSFNVSDNLIFREVEFTPVDGFDKSLAKVEAGIKNGKASFVMNTYSDKTGKKNEMTLPADSETAIATLSFIISEKNFTENESQYSDTFTIGAPDKKIVLKSADSKYKVVNAADAVEVTKDITLLGDANFDGTVNVTDSQMLADLLVALDENFEGEYNKALDVDKDGKITLKDLAILQRYMTGRYTAKEYYNFGLLENEKWA